MQSTTDDQVRELGRRWVEAEQNADLATLDAITTDDFILVGPLGFVLDKQQWLGRYRTGGLVTTSLIWDEITVRDYCDTASPSAATPRRPLTRTNQSTGDSGSPTSLSAAARNGCLRACI